MTSVRAIESCGCIARKPGSRGPIGAERVASRRTVPGVPSALSDMGPVAASLFSLPAGAGWAGASGCGSWPLPHPGRAPRRQCSDRASSRSRRTFAQAGARVLLLSHRAESSAVEPPVGAPSACASAGRVPLGIASHRGGRVRSVGLVLTYLLETWPVVGWSCAGWSDLAVRSATRSPVSLVAAPPTPPPWPHDDLFTLLGGRAVLWAGNDRGGPLCAGSRSS